LGFDLTLEIGNLSFMVEIIPAIIAKNFAELQKKVKLVEPYVKTVQLDVMDGVFVDNKTWPFDFAQGKPSVSELDNLETDIFLEAHLMVGNPHRILNEWLNAKVGRIILHWEAIEKIHNHELLPYKTQVDVKFPISNLSREVHRCGKQFGVALNPKTPIAVLDNFIGDIDLVLLMSVDPGFAGQNFKEEVIFKIIALRQRYPDVKIEVDGGVNLDNLGKLKKTGADFLVMGSAIFQSKDISIFIKEMNNFLTADNC